MSKTKKAARPEGGWSNGSQMNLYVQSNIPSSLEQRKTAPGTALTAFLKRYRVGLR